MVTKRVGTRPRRVGGLKAQRDIYTALAEAREEGRKDAQVAFVHSLQRVLRHPLTPPEELRTLPLAELERLAGQLEAEVPSRVARSP